MLLLILAILNLADGFFSFYSFQYFGNEIEANLLVAACLAIDTSAGLFLTLKIILTGSLLMYWKTAVRIPRYINGLSSFGVLLYTQMFIYGAYVFVST